ncbi:MAG: hypothetical protein RBQ97_11750 [Acholeplasma sp.]|nr:hypothetical protein [Acholeplasma sp.]
MSEEFKLPAFNFLGYNIQQIILKRLGNEQIEEIKIAITSAKYDENHKIYSLVINLNIDFTNSKNSLIEILGGFKINDESILDNQDAINSIFAASLFPYIRTTLQLITSDDRPNIVIPTLDLRYLNLTNGISIKPNKH